MKLHLTTAALIFISASLFFAGCKKDASDPPPSGPSGPGTNEVWMQNTVFSPATITVPVNTTIKWINKDNFNHTVTANNGSFDSGNISAGGTYTRQFTAAGTYPYNCTLHSGMTGTVVVQ